LFAEDLNGPAGALDRDAVLRVVGAGCDRRLTVRDEEDVRTVVVRRACWFCLARDEDAIRALAERGFLGVATLSPLWLVRVVL
jgi:hypothetical protein